MTVYTLFGQPASPGALTTDTTSYTLGLQFAISKASAATAVWFYSATGAVALPVTIAIYQVTGTGTGTLVHSEAATWSGAIGSGWVRAAFSSPPVLSTSNKYKVCVLNNAGGGNWYASTSHYWDTGAGQNGVTSGILSAPKNALADVGQGSYNAGSTLTYPATTSNASQYWMDVEVSDIYIVQTAKWAAGASGSFASAVTPGNSVVLWIMDYNVAVSTPISSSNPLYNGAAVTGAALLFHGANPDVSPNNRAMYAAVWLLPNVQSSGTSVSYTNTGGNNDANTGHVIAEVAGLGASPSLDSASPNPSTGGADSGTAVSSGSTGAAVSSSVLVVGAFMDDSTTTPTGPGAPWTTIGEQYGLAGYQIPASAGGTYAFTGTISPSEQWAAGVAIIAATPVGGNGNVNGSVATVVVAALDGTRSVTLPGPVAGVTVAALDKAPSVSVTATGQVTVVAPYGRVTGTTKSTLLMSLLP